jgi:hypothetical protein
MSTMEQAEQWTYWQVLRNARISAYLAGDLISNVGDGMLLTALPLLALSLHGRISTALAIAVVQTAPYVLATAVAFAVGFSKLRVPPRALLICDCLLRGVLFLGLGVLALRGELTLLTLIGCLLFGSIFRMLALSSRRLIVTEQVEVAGRFAVNGLLGTTTGLALYAIGPVIGGVLSASGNAGIALLADGASFFVLLAAIFLTVRPQSAAAISKIASASGWSILRRVHTAARLFVVVFCFNLFYMPVEIALPLLVHGPLKSNGTGLGVIWAGFGVGALIGAFGTNYLRRLPQQKLLVAIIAAWAAVVGLLGIAPSVPFATVIFFVGGLVYAPFTPVVYTFVQSMLEPDAQQAVITLWAAGSVVAAPIGLALSGPLIAGVGVHGGLLLSALLTIALVPLASAKLLGYEASGAHGAKKQER